MTVRTIAELKKAINLRMHQLPPALPLNILEIVSEFEASVKERIEKLGNKETGYCGDPKENAAIELRRLLGEGGGERG